MRQRIQSLSLLGILIALMIPYVVLFNGTFTFDDIDGIVRNPDLRNIYHWTDIFRTGMQPQRFVSYWFVSLGYFLTPNSVNGHRVLSILIHLLSSWVLWLNLTLLWENRSRAKELATLAISIFALSPVNVETIAIAYYRCESLGTLFLFLALWFTQQVRKYGSSLPRFGCIFFFLGASILSKEIFVVVGPMLIFLFYRFSNHREAPTAANAFYRFLALGTFFWAITFTLCFLQFQPSAGEFGTFQKVAGWKVEGHSIPFQISLAARALIEGLSNVFVGLNLTTIRLASRGSLGDGLPTLVCLFLLLGWNVLLIIIGVLKPTLRALCFSLVTVLSAYFVIPNMNIGSDHYWYLPSALVTAIGVAMGRDWLVRINLADSKVVSGAIACYLLFLCCVCAARTFDLRTHENHLVAENLNQPQVQRTWADLISWQVVTRGISYAWPKIQQARKAFPEDTYFLSSEFLYHFVENNLVPAKNTLVTLMNSPIKENHLQKLQLNFIELCLVNRRCELAQEQLKKRVFVKPATPWISERVKSIEQAFETTCGYKLERHIATTDNFPKGS